MRVYAGVDALSGRPLYLKRTVDAGPDAWREAEQDRDGLLAHIVENQFGQR